MSKEKAGKYRLKKEIKKEIKEAILTTLVIENKKSIPRCVKKIEIIFEELEKENDMLLKAISKSKCKNEILKLI